MAHKYPRNMIKSNGTMAHKYPRNMMKSNGTMAHKYPRNMMKSNGTQISKEHDEEQWHTNIQALNKVKKKCLVGPKTVACM
jgi:hypothetical protein